MLNFPLPYPNELIYSTIARYRIRLAIQSPKEFLSVLFKHRSQIATLDLPSYLPAIEMMLPEEYHFERLLYQHTLFPLYAPFIPELHRKKCFQHLQLGRANVISSPLFIRYCPECQKNKK